MESQTMCLQTVLGNAPGNTVDTQQTVVSRRLHWTRTFYFIFPMRKEAYHLFSMISIYIWNILGCFITRNTNFTFPQWAQAEKPLEVTVVWDPRNLISSGHVLKSGQVAIILCRQKPELVTINHWTKTNILFWLLSLFSWPHLIYVNE